MSRHSSAVAVGIGAGAASSRRWGFAILMVGVAVYYLFLLSNGSFRIFAPELLDKVFGNMLLHMLHGEFYVDPKVISFEGFAHDGRTYSYFGVFPALLRLLAMPFTDVGQAPLARLSCWVAVVIFVGLQLRMLLIVHDSLPSGRRAPLLLAAMAAATVLSGPQLYILGAAAIYHEPILWAAVIAAAFNLVVVRAAFGGADLGDRDMTALAALAGLALLTRVSIGATLYFGAVLLIGWTVWRRHGPGRFARPSPAGDWRLPAAAAAALRDPGLWLPLVVLGAAAAAVGAINFERWGNPLTFVDFHDYFWFKKHPDFLAVYDNYGEFDLGRVWIGALYYATGIPYVLKSIPPFAGFLLSRVALIEAPPFTPLLTNPLTVVLAGVGLYRLWWKPDLAPGALGLLRLASIGHALAVLLIFAAMAYVMRYRFDLAPFMTLAAFVGYRSVSIAAAEARAAARHRIRVAAIGLCVLGILGSHYVLLIHKVWSIGVPMQVRLALLPFAPFAHAALEP